MNVDSNRPIHFNCCLEAWTFIIHDTESCKGKRTSTTTDLVDSHLCWPLTETGIVKDASKSESG